VAWVRALRGVEADEWRRRCSTTLLRDLHCRIEPALADAALALKRFRPFADFSDACGG
jgi:hypothetical protein